LGNSCAVGASDAEHIDVVAALLGRLGSLFHVAFVVFAVGDDDDGFSNILALGETIVGNGDGGGEVGALVGEQNGGSSAHKLFGRDVIRRNRQLRVGFAGENAEGNAVVLQTVD